MTTAQAGQPRPLLLLVNDSQGGASGPTLGPPRTTNDDRQRPLTTTDCWSVGVATPLARAKNRARQTQGKKK